MEFSFASRALSTPNAISADCSSIAVITSPTISPAFFPSTREIVYYDTAAEQQQALVGGAVDVISSVSLSPVANTRIVAQFAPRPYYFVSTKGNAALIDQLDETIRRIDLVEPNLQDSLYDNYFRVVNDAFYLTDAQKAALADMGTLRVLCTENAAPYAYRTGEAPAGMLVSILNNFAEKAGLKLEYTFAPTGRAPRR